MADSATATTGNGGLKRRLPNWKFVLLALGIIALAVGAGVGVRWWQQQRQYTRLATKDAVVQDLSNATAQTVTGDFDKAHDTVDKALNNPKLSADAKFALYQQQGSIYENQGKVDEALDSYKQAESIKMTYYLAGTLASLYEQKGDKQTAIDYYKKAIPLIPDSEMMKNNIIQEYKAAITRLGGQP